VAQTTFASCEGSHPQCAAALPTSIRPAPLAVPGLRSGLRSACGFLGRAVADSDVHIAAAPDDLHGEHRAGVLDSIGDQFAHHQARRPDQLRQVPREAGLGGQVAGVPHGPGDRQQLVADRERDRSALGDLAAPLVDAGADPYPAVAAAFEKLRDPQRGCAEQQRRAGPAGGLPRDRGEQCQRGIVLQVHGGDVDKQRVRLLGEALQQATRSRGVSLRPRLPRRVTTAGPPLRSTVHSSGLPSPTPPSPSPGDAHRGSDQTPPPPSR